MRRPVVSRTMTYTRVSCLLRILPDGEPVKKDVYIVGALTDKQTAYRKVRKRLPANYYLVRIDRLTTVTETLSLPKEAFIEAVKNYELKGQNKEDKANGL